MHKTGPHTEVKRARQGLQRVSPAPRLLLLFIAATVAGLAAAAPRHRKPPPAHAPAPVLQLPAVLRTKLTPGAYEQLRRASAQAQAYFRPSTIQRRFYQEGTSFDGPRNTRCTVRLLAAGATNVSTSEGNITEIHNYPYLSETTKKNHVESCGQDGSGHDYASPEALQVSFPAGAYTVDDGAVHDFQMSMELDPSAKAKRAITFTSSAVQASCSEISRWRPGEWKPGFPFTLYVMQCNSTTSEGPEGQSIKMQRTMYFSPELSAELTCGASETSDTHGVTMQHSTFNTEVTTEGKVIRVKCALSASTYVPGKGSHSAANVSKGEVEETITLH